MIYNVLISSGWR